MWQLTLSLILLLGAAVLALRLCLRFLSEALIQVTTAATTAITEALDKVIKPVVDPGDIPQVELPEQENMFTSEAPEWEKDWDGSPRET